MSKPQAIAVINYMKKYGALTRQIAFISLDIANLTAVISDVRRMGVAVKVEKKTDPKGRSYARYTLAEQFAPGDQVRRVDGFAFSNGSYVVTVSHIEKAGDSALVWFAETNTFLAQESLIAASNLPKKHKHRMPLNDYNPRVA